ncbi:hypothetical protein SLA2020_015560 [Shorea laevis]
MKSMNETLNEKDQYILQLEEQIEFLHQRTKELEKQLAKLPLKGKDANEPTADKEDKSLLYQLMFQQIPKIQIPYSAYCVQSPSKMEKQRKS